MAAVTGILLNNLLTPKLLNNLFDFCYLINFEFLPPHTGHFDSQIVVPILVFNILESTFSVSFLALKTICQHVL